MEALKANRWVAVGVIAATAALFSGCTTAGRARMMIGNMRPMMDKMKLAVNKNSDVQLVRDAMPASLIQLDGFIEAVPDDADLLIRAAEANAGYAFLFVQDTDKHRAAVLQKKARDYALRALEHRRAFQDALKGDSNDAVAAALAEFDRSDVPALYFACSSWLSYIGLSAGENMRVLADLPRVEMMMDRILALDDTFNYGAIHATLGAYLASRPKVFGGDPEEADYHFRQAVEISQSKFLIWRYLYARYYAVQVKDRDLFVSTLEEIISAPENLLPEKNFANEAVKVKARILLSKVDDFF